MKTLWYYFIEKYSLIMKYEAPLHFPYLKYDFHVFNLKPYVIMLVWLFERYLL